ncbi:MAG: hypothetical protein DI598_14510 [Pseudopedobacter saltans]|uniref:Peptidoglycan hydrolase n=1 Tax=Pseudopedobacter saltans TaxID=151895 RepID=A0A2W5EME7_9SPHI|nr:MAG: hypothetical protein DI598_14510 [Pseudopedobacter saltans]
MDFYSSKKIKMRKLILTTAIVATGFTLSAQNNSVQDYINQYKEIAVNEMVRTGVPASITLAQGILESGSGNSKLAKYSNNHFGIKCKKEWTGETVYQDDDIKNECFRVYQTAADSYKDHSDFLKNRPYYTSLFDLDPKDYKAWAKGLKSAGYATERDYPKNLIGLIERYNLEQYSDEALARIEKGDNGLTDMAATQKQENTATEETMFAKQADKPNTNKNSLALFSDNSSSTPTSETSSGSMANNNVMTNTFSSSYYVAKNTCTLNPSIYPTTAFKINKTKVIYLPKGSSLFALATNQKMSYNKLLDYNELEAGTDILQKDRLVYLEKKPKKGEKEMHTVVIGETLDEIAQKEGLQLNSLLEYNHLQPNALPLPGESVYLRASAPNMPRLASENVVLK